MSVGVLVMAHGTPARPEELEAFYTRIRRGRPPEPAQLAELEGRYAAIGGLSPLAERTRAQVDGLRSALEVLRPGRYVVEFGAKHTEPFIEDAAAKLAVEGVARVVGLVLTPHGSSLGSLEYLERAAAALAGAPAPVPLVRVPPWYAAPGFVRLLAVRVTDATAMVRAEGAVRIHVLFTAHSLPTRVREAGDTYPAQLEESARLVAAAAGLAAGSWSVAWQSAGRTPEPWLGPDVRDEVRRLSAPHAAGAARRGPGAGAGAGGRTGVDAVVVCPIGFVADHLEVLYDLDVEVAAVARQCSVRYARTASLNDAPAFIAVLADAVVGADEAAS